MVKRKYETEEDESSKKSKSGSDTEKLTEKPQNDVVKSSKNFKHDNFDIKHFRKEISTKQGQTIALTQFLQVCLDPDSDKDYLQEYLTSGGNSHEILRQITQDNKKNLTLATPAFHLFHLIILKVQSTLPHMIAITEEACRYFLNTFMPTVEIMISENSGPRHRKIILKLLTSMVTLNPDLGIEVLNQAPLTPKHLQYIVEKVNYKEKDNVRTSFVHFMTSFLVDGHLPLIKALLEKQGLLALVFPGLIQDEADAVLMFLNILKKNIIDNPMISKSLKLKTFSHQVLHNIFKMFTWKGPSELNHETRNKARPEIMELVSEIVLILFTSHKLGLYFIDSSLGTTDANKNQNLYKALLTLKRPWENEAQCDVILQIVWKCPDLHRAVINIIEQIFEPQHSPIWERAVAFIVKLLNKLKPEDMVPKMASLSPVQIANFIRFETLPVPLLKHIQSSLGKNDHIVSLYCVNVLVKLLSTLKRYLQILEIHNMRLAIVQLKNRLEMFFPKHLPVAATVMSLIQTVLQGVKGAEISRDYSLPKPEDADSLIALIDLLLLYHELNPTFFEGVEGSLDMKSVLDFSNKLTTGNVAMLKFKIVSLWLTLDSSATSLKNPMFKDLFMVILEVYTSDDKVAWVEAKETVLKFFKNTSIFESDEEEIYIMLYALRNAKVNPISIVADIIEYVLTNIKELTECVRNQVAHFEITNENTQASLDKLFDDLMQNKNTDDSTFLENKIPSAFIVGSIQYVQDHKDLKKSLKHFLSLYIANLLHCNYSPEMTEVLVGDSKLDVRSYIAGWIGEPVAISEAMSNKDQTISKISLSVLQDEQMDLQDVFPFLEIATEEDYDLLAGEVHFKINLSTIVDSSELLIWGKYLIFCIIRLAKMEQLQDTKQKRINFYFKVIMDICKECHMTDICRIMIRNLLRNSHLLNIYNPIDQSNNKSSILATNFLLDVMVNYSDIVNHFDDKIKLLQPFQQKNYNELVKIFIKIKKKKNVNNQHTAHVLEIVGMRNIDDLLILDTIFDLDYSVLVKEDKEPSIALEVLRVLLVKYLKAPEKDLQEGVIKKLMKLYTNILTNSQMNINISQFETSLADYFEMNPCKTKYISIEDFKNFFSANSLRKSTVQLAASILKHNDLMCQVYKEELNRADVLSHREITLPLGNALIHHKIFVEKNQELLHTIWREYKSNILKLLEKPNKAGQVYVANWRFIKKLLLECSEIEDCVRIFGKLHKFDTVEIAHIHMFQALFLRMCLFTKALKKEHFTNYVMAALHLITNAVKDSKDEDAINIIVSYVYNGIQVARIVKGFNLDEKDDSKTILESAIWQNFCKTVLKDSLKVKTTNDSRSYTGPKLLSLLTELVKAIYPINHEDIVTLFDMLTSHSEFLNVMLSHHSSEIKCRLLEFVYVLILKDKSVMKGAQIPVYLSAYHATRSPSDRLILTILNFYETNDQLVHEYKPYVWGDSAANYYAVRKNRTSSLWGHPTPNQILNLLDKDMIEKTVQKFPVMQKLDYQFELSPNIDVTDEVLLDSSTKTLLNKLYKDGLMEPAALKHNGVGALWHKMSQDGLLESGKTKDYIDSAMKVFVNRPSKDAAASNCMRASLCKVFKDGQVAFDAFKDKETAVHAMVLKAKYEKILMKLQEVDLVNLSHGYDSVEDERTYDPAFLFPLMSHLLAPGSVASSFKVLRSGLLSVPVMGLSSHCPSMRAAAYHVLHRFCLLLETETKHKNDKLLLTDFIETLRNSLPLAITSPSSDGLRNPRLPAVAAMYLARALLVTTAPSDPLYKPVNNYLIAKQQVDLTVVPDFLSLFHDCDVEAPDRRLWILDVMKDGVKTFGDVNVVFKTMCLKMLMDYYSSVISDRRAKEKILDLLSAIVSVPRAADIMVEGYGLMSWLDFVVRNIRTEDKSVVKNIVTLLANLLYSSSVNNLTKLIRNNKSNDDLVRDVTEMEVCQG